jgi:hypothetical protein
METTTAALHNTTHRLSKTLPIRPPQRRILSSFVNHIFAFIGTTRRQKTEETQNHHALDQVTSRQASISSPSAKQQPPLRRISSTILRRLYTANTSRCSSDQSVRSQHSHDPIPHISTTSQAQSGAHIPLSPLPGNPDIDVHRRDDVQSLDDESEVAACTDVPAEGYGAAGWSASVRS